MTVSDVNNFLRYDDEVILKPRRDSQGDAHPTQEYKNWLALKNKTGIVKKIEWQPREAGGILITVDVDGVQWCCGPGDIKLNPNVLQQRKDEYEERRREFIRKFREREDDLDESYTKRLTINNKAYLEEALQLLNELC